MSVAPALLVLTASYAGGVVTSTVLVAEPRIYSARMRSTIGEPSLLCAIGSRICSPVLTSPCQPLSEST